MKHRKFKTVVVLLFGFGLIALQAQTVKDIDGNVYKTVKIGSQTWMSENLKTTKSNDNKAISLVTDTSWQNITTAGYCWYNNDKTSHKNIYGALYNWYAVKNGKLCPTGWHVPSDAEWTTLLTYLGGEDIAGGKLKEKGITHWKSAGTGTSNETGFTALPGGDRFDNGSFYGLNGYGIWWSSTEYSATSAWSRSMFDSNSEVSHEMPDKNSGMSVRCIKD